MSIVTIDGMIFTYEEVIIPGYSTIENQSYPPFFVKSTIVVSGTYSSNIQARMVFNNNIPISSYLYNGVKTIFGTPITFPIFILGLGTYVFTGIFTLLSNQVDATLSYGMAIRYKDETNNFDNILIIPSNFIISPIMYVDDNTSIKSVIIDNLTQDSNQVVPDLSGSTILSKRVRINTGNS